MSLVMTAAPASEPLTLEETKAFLRVSHDDDDDFIEGLIATAREICENFTGLALVTRSYSLYLDEWPENLELPHPPLASVTLVRSFSAEDEATVYSSSNYQVDTAGKPGRIMLKPGSTPPIADRTANSIEVQFTAGFGDAPEDVPAALRQGMKQIIGRLYEHRGRDTDAVLSTSGAQALFQPFRIMRFG